MKLSILMTVYNNEKYLNTAIKSILNQSFKDFEFIIIDDGSTDNSLKILKQYVKKDHRMKVFRNKTNIGLTKSLNKGLNLCQGEYIARQDADDISLPLRLEKQLNFLERNPEYAFCGTNGYREYGKNEYGKEELTIYFNIKDIRENLVLKNCFHHTSIFIRRVIFEKYGYFNENFRYAQDFEMWCRLIYKFNLNAKNLKEKLVIRRKTKGTFQKRNTKRFLTKRINGVRIMFKYLRYTKYKIKCLLIILITLIEIPLLYSIRQFFSKFLEKIFF